MSVLFWPVVCRNHCYPLPPRCSFVSFHLLPVSPLFIIFLPFLSHQPRFLAFPFCLIFSSSASLSSSLLSNISRWHWCCLFIGAILDQSGYLTWQPLEHSAINTHTHQIQMHISIAHRQPEGTNKMNDKWHKWLEDERLPWIPKLLWRGQIVRFLVQPSC